MLEMPVPMCRACGTEVSSIDSENDILTGELVLVLRCHGRREVVHIDLQAQEEAVDLEDLVLRDAFVHQRIPGRLRA